MATAGYSSSHSGPSFLQGMDHGDRILCLGVPFPPLFLQRDHSTSNMTQVVFFCFLWAHLTLPSVLYPMTDYLHFHKGVRRPV
jgi:hypothetical protein